MIVLGADLSYARTGLVWLEPVKLGYVMTGTTKTFSVGPTRLARAMNWLRGNMGKPDFCVIEDYAFGSPSRHVVVKLAELGGVFKTVLEEYDIDYLVVSPSAIKKHITGKGNAEKHVVARELKRLHGIGFEHDPGYDLSDAAACAVWGINHLRGGK